jgi:serine/threonine protein phosphatase PrpC
MIKLSNKLNFTYHSAQALGGRDNQEDFYGVFEPPSKALERRGTIFIVSDGMGGRAEGATASAMLVEFFRDNYYQVTDKLPKNASIPTILKEMIPAANQQLLDHGDTDNKFKGMGATLLVAVVQGNRLYWGSVGDSHLYLIRERQITLLNQDHSVGGEIDRRLAEGRMSQEQAQKSLHQRHRLFHYMGKQDLAIFDVSPQGFKLQANDSLILCTDGLDDTLDKIEILEAALLSDDQQNVASRLANLAIERGGRGQDNVTALVAAFSGEKQTLLRVALWAILALTLLIAVIFYLWRADVIFTNFQSAPTDNQNLPSATKPMDKESPTLQDAPVSNNSQSFNANEQNKPIDAEGEKHKKSLALDINN